MDVKYYGGEINGCCILNNMRVLASIILVILTVPLLLIGILSATARFKALDPDFWITTFEKNNVYSEITESLKEMIVDTTVKEGGSPGEITLITDLVTPLNVKDFVDKNIKNVLNYANGKETELFIYIPVGRAPKGFLPKEFENLPENMPATSLFEKLNIGFTPAQIQYVSLVGRALFYLLIADLAVLFLFVLLLFVLASPGAHLISIGIAFLISGVVSLVVFFLGNRIVEQMAASSPSGPEALTLFLAATVPPALERLLSLWLFAGLGLAVLGVLFLVLRKPR